MTREEKIDFLQQYLDMEPEIIRLQNEIDRWRSVAERCTPVLGLASAGAGADKLQASIDEIDALQRQLGEELSKVLQARRNVESVIKSTHNTIYKRMLAFRYLEGWTFDRIAIAMNKSERQVYRWHENFIMSLNVSISA